MNKKVFRTAIILCWVFLGICFLIKLGSCIPILNKIINADTFTIVVNNKTFKAIYDFLDAHYIIQSIVYFPFNLITNTLYLLAILRQKWFDKFQCILVYISLPIIFVIKCINAYIGLVADIYGMIILPIICLYKTDKKYYFIILGFVLDLVFQLVSMVVKNIGFVFVTDNSLTTLITGIDLDIMLVLYYLYAVYYKKDKENKENE